MEREMNKQTQNTIWALESELRSHKNEIARLKEELASVEKDAQAGKEIIRIEHDGRVIWNGREVKTDDEFRTAMLALKDALTGGYYK
jgi:DNA-binding protein YbaB